MAGSSRITTRLDNLESAFGRLKASQQDLQRQLNFLNPKSEYLKEIYSDLLQAETRIAELTRRSNGLRDEMYDIIEKNTATYETMRNEIISQMVRIRGAAIEKEERTTSFVKEAVTAARLVETSAHRHDQKLTAALTKLNTVSADVAEAKKECTALAGEIEDKVSCLPPSPSPLSQKRDEALKKVLEMHDRRIELIEAKLGFNGRASIKLRIQAAQRVGWERNTREGKASSRASSRASSAERSSVEIDEGSMQFELCGADLE